MDQVKIPPPALIAKFWSHVDRSAGPDGCWIWKRTPTKEGYGRLSWNYERFYTHRFAWLIVHGSLPPHPLVLDHLCRNRLCANPARLRVTTLGENIMAGESPCGINKRKTHCNNGHELTGRNLIISRGGRRCRICDLAWQKLRCQKLTREQIDARNAKRRERRRMRRLQCLQSTG